MMKTMNSNMTDVTDRTPASDAAIFGQFSPPQARLLDADSYAVKTQFPWRPFLVRHHLAGNPLFELQQLAELARSLPEKDVEYNAGNIPVSVDPSRTPRTGLSIEETVRRIEECGSWMVLKFVEQFPEYRRLLHGCLQEVFQLFGRPWKGLSQYAAFIFISSPSAITPYHIDPEHNFLLQLRGRKTLNVFDPDDRSLLSELELEKFYSGSHRNLVFQEYYQRKARVFELGPGDGLHVPVTAPHWVKNGDAVSISFSITFRSALSESRETVYKVNHRLRQLGLRPTPYGRRPTLDIAKCQAYRMGVGVAKRLRPSRAQQSAARRY
jgi:hypothetical protein